MKKTFILKRRNSNELMFSTTELASWCSETTLQLCSESTTFIPVSSHISWQDVTRDRNDRRPMKATSSLVCYTTVFSIVTQCSSPALLRYNTKNGCVADYVKLCNKKFHLTLHFRKTFYKMESVIEANNKFTVDLHKALKND